MVIQKPVQFHPSLYRALKNPAKYSAAAIHAIKEVMERVRANEAAQPKPTLVPMATVGQAKKKKK